MRLDPDGAERHRAVLDARMLERLMSVLSGQPAGQAGVRLFGVEGLREFLGPGGPVHGLATAGMDGEPRPVRAILFDKSAAANWMLGWHQDRVVAVRERIAVSGFGPWTRKHGALHVSPPYEVLANMRTVRVHLDAVPETNAPLVVAPGSHKLGAIPQQQVAEVIKDCGSARCLADAGDVWVYATPILHASERAVRPARRRVLQVDYAGCELPGGLRWLGV